MCFQYLHVIIGFLIAYYVGYIEILGFHIDIMLLIPVVEFIVLLEKMFPRIKAMVCSVQSAVLKHFD